MVKQKCSRVLSVFIALFLIFSIVSPVSVFADLDKSVVFTDSNINVVSIAEGMGAPTGTNSFSSGNVTWSGEGLVVMTKGTPYTLLKYETTGSSGGKFSIDPSAFKEAKKDDVTKAMKLFTDGLTNSGGSADTVQQIMADIQDTDSSVSSVMLPLIFASTKGDMYQAYKISSPFLEILSVVLGVGAVLLILLLLFSTVMDLAYIGLPVWREAQAGKEGGKNPFGVSYEALTTVKEVEKGLGGGDGGYRNAYLLYFKRRALTYIILAICIFYLICGGLSGIIGFVLNLVSGITG